MWITITKDRKNKRTILIVMKKKREMPSKKEKGIARSRNISEC